MSRAKPSNRTHAAGTTEFNDARKKQIREVIAGFGRCDCRDSGFDDCHESCAVRSYVDDISSAVFFPSTLASMSTPRERAANLEQLIKLLRRIESKLEPKFSYSSNGELVGAEGRSEELELFDEETLRRFGLATEEGLIAAAETSPFISLIKRLEQAAEARRQKLLEMPKAKRRETQKGLENELTTLWVQHFGEPPPSTPEGVFAEVVKMVSKRRYTPKARQSAIERARQNVKPKK